jgi:SH3-like domain-containing protein
VAQSWVNVRASASIGAAVVGVVTPNTRVQLGDRRGGWRRVRSAGFEGWADGNLFDADTSATR